MAGYTRQDTANNIANGNVIDADDFDAEYNAIEAAFNGSSGHSHDGSTGNGAPITVVGPAQDVIVSGTSVLPKATDTLDLGSNAVRFKDAFLSGDLGVQGTTNLGTNGYTSVTDNTYAVSSGALTVDVAGDINLDADGGNVLLQDGGITYGGFTNNSSELAIKSGTTTAATFTGANVDLAGTLDVTGATTLDSTLNVVGNTTVSSGNLTVNTGNVTIGGALGVTGTITGSLVGNVTGDVEGDVQGNVTGIVSSLENHSTTVLSEGTNLYYTDARARAAISATGSLSYNNTTGVMSFTQGSTDTVAEGSTNLYYTDTRVQNYINGNRTYGGVTTTGNVVVGGNLTVSGTTTTVNTETINLADNIITLNSNEAGSPTQNAGIEVERGTATNKSLIWDEANDRWTVGTDSFVADTFVGDLSGNVTGNVTGNLTGDVTGNVTGNVTATNVSATGIITGELEGNVTGDVTGNVSVPDNITFTEGSSDWKFEVSPSTNELIISYGGVNKMKLDPSGNLTVTGNVTAYGQV